MVLYFFNFSFSLDLKHFINIKIILKRVIEKSAQIFLIALLITNDTNIDLYINILYNIIFCTLS